MSIFCDWARNRGNLKGQIILLAFRIASFCSSLSRPYVYFTYPYVGLYRVVVEWFLSVELPWRLSLGEGACIYHGHALVVNDRAKIGRRCILRHSTTIGVATTSSSFEGDAPVIGDGVDIGCNVVILGGVSIGDGAVIGAGSVVVKDVPAYSVVVGNPAKVIRFLSAKE